MDEPLRLTVDGALAGRIRAAARSAGSSPAAWVANLVARELGAEEAAAEPQDPVDPLVALADPAGWESRTDEAGVFAVLVPRGWRSHAWTQPGPASRHCLVTAASPDDSLRLSSGDAGLPMFADPRFPMFQRPPGVVPRPPASAEQFASEWVGHRYAGADLELTGWRDSPELAQIVTRMVQRQGGQLTWSSAGLLFFRHDGRQAVAAVATTGIGPFWLPQVHAADGRGVDAEGLVPILLTLVGSLGLTEAEQQRAFQVRAARDAQHQATMATIDAGTRIMAAGHQQRMHDIAASGAAHQQRMADLQGTWQAQQDSWEARQGEADRQHDVTMSGLRTGAADPSAGGSTHLDHLNMIREEKTLIDPDGYEHQVSDIDADRYYYNAHEQRWLGLQQHEDLHDVARAQGLDPNAWQQGRIKS